MWWVYAWLIAGVLHGQSAEEPVSVPLKFWGEFYSTPVHGMAPTATITVSLAGTTSSLSGSGSAVSSPLKSTELILGKNYTFTYNLAWSGSGVVGISKLAVRPPRGYRVIFNGKDEPSFDPSGNSGRARCG
jgi:hypothetical protein